MRGRAFYMWLAIYLCLHIGFFILSILRRIGIDMITIPLVFSCMSFAVLNDSMKNMALKVKIVVEQKYSKRIQIAGWLIKHPEEIEMIIHSSNDSELNTLLLEYLELKENFMILAILMIVSVVYTGILGSIVLNT